MTRLCAASVGFLGYPNPSFLQTSPLLTNLPTALAIMISNNADPGSTLSTLLIVSHAWQTPARPARTATDTKDCELTACVPMEGLHSSAPALQKRGVDGC